MKPGILTTEFWLVVAINVLTQAGAIDVPDRYKWIVSAATIVGYSLARGLAKTNPLLPLAAAGDDLDAVPDEAPPVNVPVARPVDVPADQGDVGGVVR